jgi:acetyl-CoA carboxylase biotin carboxyl carrier protein
VNQSLALSNGDQKASGALAGGDAAALAAVCWAAGTLLASAPAPVSRLRVRCGEVSVDLQWPSSPVPVPAAENTAEPAEPERSTMAYVSSPIVGTFYHAPAPGESPFVKVGDLVEAGQQVGIVEAMKLMNAVEADRPGKVMEILVADATGVEFEQRLVALAPLDGGG